MRSSWQPPRTSRVRKPTASLRGGEGDGSRPDHAPQNERAATTGRRFFLRHFFASCKQAPRSSGLGEELGESDLAELDGAGHQPASTEGHTPAARARDLGDQPVGVQAAQQAGDLAGLLFWPFGEREWSPSEL